MHTDKGTAILAVQQCCSYSLHLLCADLTSPSTLRWSVKCSMSWMAWACWQPLTGPIPDPSNLPTSPG